MEQKLIAFERLLKIMDELREKCPWDKKQTMESLRYLTIEETYELSDAIVEKDMDMIKKELGDLMLHLVFYARIASESNAFNIADVLNGLCEKLIYRHPHIYSNTTANTAEEVKENWEKLKIKEGEQVGQKRKSILAGVPPSLPALIKAARIQEKASSIGFDWENRSEVFGKVKEELDELEVEIAQAKSNTIPDKIEAEFGDVLFSLINYARFIGINPEDALEKTNKKFIKRFQFIEQEAVKNNKVIEGLSLAEMNEYWELAKRNNI